MYLSDVWDDAYLHNLQSVGVLGDVLYILVSSVESHWLFSYGVCVCVRREREGGREGGREGERERHRERERETETETERIKRGG